jgi:hypothetical protein
MGAHGRLQAIEAAVRLASVGTLAGTAMSGFRYYLALLLTVCLPPLLLYWLLLHPFVRFWRGLGPGLSFGIIWGLMALGEISGQ